MQAAVARSDLSDVPTVEYGEFTSDVAQLLQQFTADSAVKNVTSLLITEIASGVGGAAATQLLAAVTTRLAAMAATSSAAAGGVTATAAAGGGGGGSTVGPVGTAIGFGVGLVVGIAIDWWMTASFEEKLSDQLNEMIDQFESSVIGGVDDEPGLDRALQDTCDALRDTYRQSLYDSIVKVAAE